MTTSPKLTVLLSAYNSRRHIGEAIESILEQSYSNFRFRIIDDASSDGTAELIQEYAVADDRIEFVQNDRNRGLGYNLRRGVEEAGTEWIARMDADDIAAPKRIETQIAHLRAHDNVDILGTWANDIDEYGVSLGLRMVPVEDADIKRLIWTNPIIHPSAIFRRKAILAVGSYSETLARRQDYDLWFRCVAGGLTFGNIPEPLLEYRLSDAHFVRNDWKVMRTHLRVGWQGCALVRAGPRAYFGVSVPAMKALVPLRFRRSVHNALRKFDPRAKCN